jgi:hypothetical protein
VAVVNTAVALFVFNRPRPTARVFAAIAAARPPRLLLIADGPRAAFPADVEACRAVRDLVARVDWPCDVRHLYADANMGCRSRMLSGLDWVFAQEERAILLEDDCLPDPTFFPFCEELLERYAADPRVGAIVGTNAVRGLAHDDSYFYSRYPFIWGWATWRRAWTLCDQTMSDWPAARQHGVLDGLFKRRTARFWSDRLDRAHRDGERETEWIHPWFLSCWKRNALTIMPAVNLIANIGFDGDGTHLRERSWLTDMPTAPLSPPLRHPVTVAHDAAADAILERDVFIPPRRWRPDDVLRAVRSRLSFRSRRQ